MSTFGRLWYVVKRWERGDVQDHILVGEFLDHMPELKKTLERQDDLLLECLRVIPEKNKALRRKLREHLDLGEE